MEQIYIFSLLVTAFHKKCWDLTSHWSWCLFGLLELISTCFKSTETTLKLKKTYCMSDDLKGVRFTNEVNNCKSFDLGVSRPDPDTHCKHDTQLSLGNTRTTRPDSPENNSVHLDLSSSLWFPLLKSIFSMCWQFRGRLLSLAACSKSCSAIDSFRQHSR